MFLKVTRFEKIHLKPNESKFVTFKLDLSDLTFIGSSMERIAEVGNFTIMIENLYDSFRLNSVSPMEPTTTSSYETTTPNSASSTLTTVSFVLFAFFAVIYNF